MAEEIIISIITINYNGLKDTCELMETLPLDDESIEVIVVDNASQQDEASVIQQRYPQVKVIRSKENLGFAGGNNLGIEASSGKYLYFINNDTLLYLQDDLVKKPKYGMQADLRHLVERFESNPQIGVVCPKIRFTWGELLIQYAGYTPLSRITLRNHAIGFNESDFGQYDIAHPTPYAHGAAMMVRREAIEKAGMMPTCYFLYYEELDWSMMIRRAGYEIWYEPASTIYHKESQTTGQSSKKFDNYFKGDIKGKTVALLGLAFKPNTDDMREAPSLVLIDKLRAAGCHVKAYDPVAMEECQRRIGDAITYCTNVEDTFRDADALFLVTEWAEFRVLDFDQVSALMRHPVIFDGRNIYNAEEVTKHHIDYFPIGFNA